jgi:hypothetical protein
MFKKLSVTAIAVFVSAANLGAAELYIGAGLAGEVESGSFRDDLERFTDVDDNAWKLFAGARFGDHLALEVARYDLGTQTCCRGIADLGFTSSVDGLSAALLGRWPAGRVAPFVKAGVLSWSEDGEFITLIGPSPRSADGEDLLLGAGVDVDLPASFGLRAEWERYEFGSATSDSVWAALLFRF